MEEGEPANKVRQPEGRLLGAVSGPPAQRFARPERLKRRGPLILTQRLNEPKLNINPARSSEWFSLLRAACRRRRLLTATLFERAPRCRRSAASRSCASGLRLCRGASPSAGAPFDLAPCTKREGDFLLPSGRRANKKEGRFSEPSYHRIFRYDRYQG